MRLPLIVFDRLPFDPLTVLLGALRVEVEKKNRVKSRSEKHPCFRKSEAWLESALASEAIAEQSKAENPLLGGSLSPRGGAGAGRRRQSVREWSQLLHKASVNVSHVHSRMRRKM